MSIFGDVATEHTVLMVVKAVKKEMDASLGSDYEDEVWRALKEVGRAALLLLDNTTPEWFQDYQKLFSGGKNR